MEFVNRALDIEGRTHTRSCFLFGPRQTGKSTLIEHAVPAARVYNLLDSDVFRSLSRQPSVIRKEDPAPGSLLVIDEIQKLPELLDEVHLAGIRALKEEALHRHYVVASLVPRSLVVNGIRVMPWRDFLETLWADKFA